MILYQSRTRRRPWSVAGVRAAVALAASLLFYDSSLAGQNGTAQSLPHYEETACDFELERPRKAVCGVLTVLENRSSGSDRQVTIPVVTFLSEDEAKHQDPVVYVPGGPGFASILSSMQLLTFWPSWLKNADWLAGRDLIIFDPRGTGMASPSLDCPEEKAQIESLPFFGDSVELYRTCFQRLGAAGIDISAYHTPALAADLNELRRAMGIEAWNIWAESHGTRVALEAMRQDQLGIRGVILDGPYPPGVNDPYLITRNFDRILTEMMATCPLHDLCAQYAPDLPALLEELLEELAKNPRELRMLSNLDFKAKTYTVDDAGFLGILFGLSHHYQGLRGLPFTIIIAHQGSFDFGALQPRDFLEVSPHMSLGANLLVYCSDGAGADPARVREAAEQFPYLAGWTKSFWTRDQCQDVLGPQDLVLDPSLVESSLPVLILAGVFDPITPVPWAYRTAEGLPNSYTFVFPGESHGVGENQCAQRIMKTFLDDPESRPFDPCFALETAPRPGP